MRDTLVLGRYGERPGGMRQHTTVAVERSPALVEELPLDAATSPGFLGGHRVLCSVLLLGRQLAPDPAAPDRYDLDASGHLWRRLGVQAHETALPDAWSTALRAIG